MTCQWICHSYHQWNVKTVTTFLLFKWADNRGWESGNICTKKISTLHEYSITRPSKILHTNNKRNYKFHLALHSCIHIIPKGKGCHGTVNKPLPGRPSCVLLLCRCNEARNRAWRLSSATNPDVKSRLNKLIIEWVKFRRAVWSWSCFCVCLLTIIPLLHSRTCEGPL